MSQLDEAPLTPDADQEGGVIRSPGSQAVADLATDPDAATDEQKLNDATAWFLSEDEDETGADETSFYINVAPVGAPKKLVKWTVHALARERIREIRRMNTTTTGGNEVENEIAVNLRISTEGTRVPDLRDPAIRGKYLDPADALRSRFRNKPGLIDQIAGRVMACSGYDAGDLIEIEAGKD